MTPLLALLSLFWLAEPAPVKAVPPPPGGKYEAEMTKVVSDRAKEHVAAVERGLNVLGIEVRRAPRLVRGLDYYLRTVFEVVAPELGEDTVICGGGRYDRLIADLGGPAVPGVGFAIGQDRLIDVLPASFRERVLGRRPVAVLPLDDGASSTALDLVRSLAVRGVAAHCEVTGRSLKAGLKWAAKLAARAVVIVGGSELAEGAVVVRDLDRGEQETVAIHDAPDRLERLLAG